MMQPWLSVGAIICYWASGFLVGYGIRFFSSKKQREKIVKQIIEEIESKGLI